jgi:hypothetical protein
MRDCSGHGSIDPATDLCVCDYGWGSIGDFSPDFAGSSVACDQNLAQIRGLALGTAILALAIFPYKVLFFFLRLHSKSSVATKSTQGLFVCSSMMHDMTMVVNGILKFVSPETFVFGNSYSSTRGLGMDLLLIINASAFAMINHSVALNLTSFLDGYSKVMPEAMRSVRAFSSFIRTIGLFIPFSAVVFSLLPAIAHSNPKVGEAMSEAYMLGFSICGLLGGLILLEIFRIILREVGTFLVGKEDTVTTASVRKLYKTARTQAIILVIRVILTWTLWITFIYQPYCRRHFSVLFMAHYLTGYPVVAFGVSAMWNFRKPTDVQGTVARMVLSRVIKESVKPGGSLKNNSSTTSDLHAEFSNHPSTIRPKNTYSDISSHGASSILPVDEYTDDAITDATITGHAILPIYENEEGL